MRSRYLAAFALAIAAPFSDASRSASPQPIRPESRIWFTGASNIRRFTCEARQLARGFELRGVPTRGPVLIGENASADPSLSVAVDKLDCGIGAMNRHLHEVLGGALHPTIEFRLTAYQVDLKTPTPLARITGLVAIAGVQHPLAATATVRADTLGILYVRGSYVIHPTEFGVAPPRRFGGLLRVHDDVTVHFEVVLDPDGGSIDVIACRLLELLKATDATRPWHS